MSRNSKNSKTKSRSGSPAILIAAVLAILIFGDIDADAPAVPNPVPAVIPACVHDASC